MRAFVLKESVSPEQIALSEVDTPSPGPGEALIRLKAAALNHRDLWMLGGALRQPAIPGSDGSGVVEAAGPGVTTVRPGDPVIVNPSLHWGSRQDAYDAATWSILGVPVNGTFAEYIAVPAAQVYPRPAHLSFEEAAALPLAGLTAYRALFAQGEMQPGDHALIHGIGGGVALFALQFARAFGARVMVTSTQDWKLARAAELGADAGANSKSGDWVKQAREWTGGRGVDLVIDSLGGEYLSRSLEALRLGGRVVNYGRTLSAEAAINVRLLFWNQLKIIGTTMGSPADFAGMLAYVQQHEIHPIVDRTYPLGEIGAALARLQSAGQFGKIVLRV